MHAKPWSHLNKSCVFNTSNDLPCSLQNLGSNESAMYKHFASEKANEEIGM